MSTAHKPPQPPIRILLVDDNRHGNIARKTVLEQQGFYVECALSGEEAIENLSANSFDVVVTDLKMKKMSGLDVIAHVRTDSHPAITILLSGWALGLGMTEESTGADAVLCKSNKEEELLPRTIRQLLARRTKRKLPTSQKSIATSVARSG